MNDALIRDVMGSCDQWALEGIQQLKPYQPGKPLSELEREYGVSDAVKLASNENPLGCSPLALEAMRAELQDLWLYPDGGGFELRRALAERHGVDAACITLGNGSNDTLVLLAETFLAPGRSAVYSQYAFAVYPIATQAAGAQGICVSANGPDHQQPLGHNLDAMLHALEPETRIVFIANPNNPTGTWLMAEEIEGFLDSVPSDVIVVMDEAYFEYASIRDVPDATRWLDSYPNLVVSRTFSKAYGLAGIRVGYMISSPQIAGLLNRIRQPFNVNSLALSGATAALRDQAFIDRTVAVNMAGLMQLREGLAKLNIGVADSACNFILADLGRDTADINEHLLRQGIIVRPVANYGLPNHLRITIGTQEQNNRLLRAVETALHEASGP